LDDRLAELPGVVKWTMMLSSFVQMPSFLAAEMHWIPFPRGFESLWHWLHDSIYWARPSILLDRRSESPTWIRTKFSSKVKEDLSPNRLQP